MTQRWVATNRAQIPILKGRRQLRSLVGDRQHSVQEGMADTGVFLDTQHHVQPTNCL